MLPDLQEFRDAGTTDVPIIWQLGTQPDVIYPHECYYRSYRYATHVGRITEAGVYLVHGESVLGLGGHAWVELQ